jgi:hypothetical protein
MGAKLWLSYEARELCSFSEDIYGWAILYAFAHSFEPEKLIFNSFKELKSTILKWGRKISCTDKEITEALMEMGEFNDFENEKQKDEATIERENKKITISPILAFLIKEFGKDIHYWLWEVSENQINEMIREYTKHMSAKNGKEKTIITSDDVPIKAYVKMRMYVEDLKIKSTPTPQDGSEK